MRSVRAVTHIMDWDWWPHQLQPRHPASKKSYQSGQVAQKISRSETGQTSQASHKNQIKMDHGKHICWILYDFVGYIFHLQQLLVSTPISKTPMPAPPESSLAPLEASSNYWSMMTWWNSCEDSHVNTSWWRVSSKTTECHQGFSLTKKFLEGQPSSRCDAVNQLVHLQSQLAWNKSWKLQSSQSKGSNPSMLPACCNHNTKDLNTQCTAHETRTSKDHVHSNQGTPLPLTWNNAPGYNTFVVISQQPPNQKIL